VSEVKEAKLWWNGPTWLKEAETTWPEWCIPQLTPEILQDMEIVASRALYEITSVTSHDVASVGTNCGVDEENYSSLRKLLRVTVYFLKFIRGRIWLTLSQAVKEVIEEYCTLC